jgi:hypothetical protein
MTQTPTIAAPTTTRHPGADRRLAVLSMGLAGLTYLVWRGAGVEPAVRGSHGVLHVGLVSVLVTAAVVSVAGLGLLCFIERRDAHGVRTWTLIAALVWLVSFLGPLGAVDLTSGLALASLHLVVGAALVVGARWTRQRGVA